MRLVDRYIAGRFILNFSILLMLLFIFAISIDVLLELDEYVDAAKLKVGEEAGAISTVIAFIEIVFNFHYPRIFQFYAYMVGLLSVGAMGFTLAEMHRNRETTALLAAGMRLQRVALPIIVAAFGLNLVQLVNQEFVLPRMAPMLIRKHGDIGREGVQAFIIRFTADGNGNLLQAPKFDPHTSTLKLPTFLDRDEEGRTVRRVTADEAIWNDEDDAWHLVNGRSITPRTQDTSDTTAMLLGTTIERYPSSLTPEVLTMRRFGQFATMLSLGQIRDMLQAPGVIDSAALVRFAYSRFTTVLINMVVLIMVLPYFLLREPASLLRNSVLCAGTAIPATMGSLLALAMPFPGIPPVVGVFLPVLVLIPVAIFMTSTVRT